MFAVSYNLPVLGKNNKTDDDAAQTSNGSCRANKTAWRGPFTLHPPTQHLGLELDGELSGSKGSTFVMHWPRRNDPPPFLSHSIVNRMAFGVTFSAFALARQCIACVEVSQ